MGILGPEKVYELRMTNEKNYKYIAKMEDLVKKINQRRVPRKKNVKEVPKPKALEYAENSAIPTWLWHNPDDPANTQFPITEEHLCQWINRPVSHPDGRIPGHWNVRRRDWKVPCMVSRLCYRMDCPK